MAEAGADSPVVSSQGAAATDPYAITPSPVGTGTRSASRRRRRSASPPRPDCYADHAVDGWRFCSGDCAPGFLPRQWVFAYRLVLQDVLATGELPLKQTKIQGVPVGRWMERQRQAKDRMQVERRNLLEAIPGWVWEPARGRRPQPDRWLTRRTEYVAFLEAHGGQAPTHATDRSLYDWARLQQDSYAAGRLDPDRVRLLEVIPGWSWDRPQRAQAEPKPRGFGNRPLTGFTPTPVPGPRSALSPADFVDHWDEPIFDPANGLAEADWGLATGLPVQDHRASHRPAHPTRGGHPGRGRALAVDGRRDPRPPRSRAACPPERLRAGRRLGRGPAGVAGAGGGVRGCPGLPAALLPRPRRHRGPDPEDTGPAPLT